LLEGIKKNERGLVANTIDSFILNLEKLSVHFTQRASPYRLNVRPPREIVPLPRPLAVPLSEVGVLVGFIAGLSTKEVSVVIVISCAALLV
jgi:hypothetical protein